MTAQAAQVTAKKMNERDMLGALNDVFTHGEVKATAIHEIYNGATRDIVDAGKLGEAFNPAAKLEQKPMAQTQLRAQQQGLKLGLAGGPLNTMKNSPDFS